MEVTINDLLQNVASYNMNGLEKIRKAYEYADEMHKGQVRQSGEAYITHPLNVALILSEMNADVDTICAALLHDTLEDTNATKEEIADLFNKEVANLVDGVTKISKLNYSSRNDLNMANTKKIILGLTEDVRIIIIKLADRLHNMRTLEFKSEFKQKENSLETMELYVPLAYYIGAYRIKSELEDLSLKYLKPDTYKELIEKRSSIEEVSKSCLQEMLQKINIILTNKNIPFETKVRIKNVYGIYKSLSNGKRLSDIHDLLSLKLMVNNVDECYQALGLVHSLYHPINDKFKDYICNPKTNMYQSLHTTVFGPEERLVQTQIRTFDMDKIASFGLTNYWELNQNNAREKMQEDLKDKYQFFKSLIAINTIFGDNQQFCMQVKEELFADKVYVYTSKGEIMELPKGATIIDFAYKIHTEVGNTLVGAYVNDELVPLSYVLQNKDRVRVITDKLAYGYHDDWLNLAKTSYAKRKIRELHKNI